MFNLESYLNDLEELVNIDSGTYNIEGVNKAQDWMCNKFVNELGFNATTYDVDPEHYGKSMLYTKGDSDNFDVLVLCHMDTVFPKGEVDSRPFSRGNGEVYGPGSYDMKCGCIFAYYVAKEIQDNKIDAGNIAYLFNSNEEASSVNSREFIESAIKKSKIVMSGEPTRSDGSFVKQRKGVLRYKFEFEGVTAHSGNNPQDGQCAVLEMAKWIVELKSMQNFDRGITINTGLVKGGTAVNSIPDHAELVIDIRVKTIEDSVEMEKRIAALKPFNPKIKVTVTGGTTRPPMVSNNKTEVLCKIVEELGKKNGLTVKWAFAGGGSDASFASALGKPALCALSARGKGAHSKHEIVFTDDIKERYELFRDMAIEFSKLTDQELNK